MTPGSLFVVRATQPSGTTTYRCPTPEWALKKLSDFQAAGRASITIIGPDGRVLTEADLRVIAAGRDGAPRAAARIPADLES